MNEAKNDEYCGEHFRKRSELATTGAVAGALLAGIFVPGPGWIIAGAAIGGLFAANAHKIQSKDE